jgi:hypothetical protein
LKSIRLVGYAVFFVNPGFDDGLPGDADAFCLTVKRFNCLCGQTQANFLLI